MNVHFTALYFEATRLCNLQCSICMSSSNVAKKVRESRRRELTTDEIERYVFETAREIGIQTIGWSGGEFLLREDALELLRRAHGHGYHSSVCSNGVALTREKLEEVREAAGGDVVLAVGVNSLDETNAASRDTGAETALAALELCKEMGLRRHVVVNVGRHNMQTLGQTLRYLADRGIPYNRSPFTARGSGACAFAGHCPSSGEMEKHIHPELRKHACGYVSFTPFFLSPELHESFSKGAKNVTVPQNPSIGCWVGTWLGMNAEGDVSPCGILLDDLNAGNVRETPLPRIVTESEVFRRILDRSQLGGKCGRCRYQYTCGGCRAMAFYRSGDYMDEDPTCFFEPVDRTTVSEHEAETNEVFKRYAFMARFTGARI
ncbi:MAG: radical SAM protein [Planctomycetes bacterium]|nr:radical SAM protein [Planctomycetota bacterium]